MSRRCKSQLVKRIAIFTSLLLMFFSSASLAVKGQDSDSPVVEKKNLASQKLLRQRLLSQRLLSASQARQKLILDTKIQKDALTELKKQFRWNGGFLMLIIPETKTGNWHLGYYK